MTNPYNPNKRERYIMLYADDYLHDTDIWDEICKALGVSSSETEVRVNFDYKDVLSGSEMEELKFLLHRE